MVVDPGQFRVAGITRHLIVGFLQHKWEVSWVVCCVCVKTYGMVLEVLEGKRWDWRNGKLGIHDLPMSGYFQATLFETNLRWIYTASRSDAGCDVVIGCWIKTQALWAAKVSRSTRWRAPYSMQSRHSRRSHWVSHIDSVEYLGECMKPPSLLHLASSPTPHSLPSVCLIGKIAMPHSWALPTALLFTTFGNILRIYLYVCLTSRCCPNIRAWSRASFQ